MLGDVLFSCHNTGKKRAGCYCHSVSEIAVTNHPTVCRTAPSIHRPLKMFRVAPWSANGQLMVGLVGSTLLVCCVKLESCKHLKGSYASINLPFQHIL